MIELEQEAAAVKEQRAFLIGFLEPDQDRSVLETQLDELAELVRNLDIIPLEPEIIRLRSPQVRYRAGSGKAAEIAQLVQECEADLLVFDADLTPSQQRNWEKLTASFWTRRSVSRRDRRPRHSTMRSESPESS